MKFCRGESIYTNIKLSLHIKDGKNLIKDLCSKFKTTDDWYDEFTGLLTSMALCIAKSAK